MLCGNITFLITEKCAKFNPQILCMATRSLAHEKLFYLFLISTIFAPCAATESNSVLFFLFVLHSRVALLCAGGIDFPILNYSAMTPYATSKQGNFSNFVPLEVARSSLQSLYFQLRIIYV
jgi:hypothetical protein